MLIEPEEEQSSEGNKIKKRERQLTEPEEVQASEGTQKKVGKIILPPKNSLSARVGKPLVNTDEETPMGLLSQQKFGLIVTYHVAYICFKTKKFFLQYRLNYDYTTYINTALYTDIQYT